MVCQVYTVPSSKAYISVKSGASPGANLECFLFSFNVAGVVFKKKTDGGVREDYCFSEHFLCWNPTDMKTLQARASPAFTPLQHSHIFTCPVYILENAHDFCFHLAYMATAKLSY